MNEQHRTIPLSRRAKHCVVTDRMKCLHCGEELKIPLPIRVTIFEALAVAFIKEHQDCKPR